MSTYAERAAELRRMVEDANRHGDTVRAGELAYKLKLAGIVEVQERDEARRMAERAAYPDPVPTPAAPTLTADEVTARAGARAHLRVLEGRNPMAAAAYATRNAALIYAPDDDNGPPKEAA